MTYVFEPTDIGIRSVFLAGTIDMNNSADWQKEFIDQANAWGSKIAIYNPRRKDWNSEWTAGSSEMRWQIAWELYWMEKVDVIFMRFAPGSESPISLLELGLWAGKNPSKIVVQCSKNYYRYANVKAICKRYGVEMAWHEDIPRGWMQTVVSKLQTVTNE